MLNSLRRSSFNVAVNTAALVLLLLPVAVQSQFVVAPRAGLISLTEGQVVLLNPSDGDSNPDLSNDVIEGGRLSTKHGRAEVVLTPNCLLRLDKSTDIELVASDITDVQVRMLSGSVIIDLMKAPKKHSVTALFEEVKIAFVKRGMYRVDAAPDGPAQLSVLRGKALVSSEGAELEVAAKQSMPLTSSSAATELASFQGNAFHAWNRKRAKFISEARRRGQQLALGNPRQRAGSTPVNVPGMATPQRPAPQNTPTGSIGR